MNSLIAQLQAAALSHPQAQAWADSGQSKYFHHDKIPHTTFTDGRMRIKVSGRVNRLSELADLFGSIKKSRASRSNPRKFPIMFCTKSVKEYVHAYYKLNSTEYKQFTAPYGTYDSKAINDFFEPLSDNQQSSISFDNIEEACDD